MTTTRQKIGEKLKQVDKTGQAVWQGEWGLGGQWVITFASCFVHFFCFCLYIYIFSVLFRFLFFLKVFCVFPNLLSLPPPPPPLPIGPPLPHAPPSHSGLHFFFVFCSVFFLFVFCFLGLLKSRLFHVCDFISFISNKCFNLMDITLGPVALVALFGGTPSFIIH